MTVDEISYGLVSSFEFNPLDSNKVVIGFTNVSPKFYDFSDAAVGYRNLYPDIEQPTSYNNYKMVAYMPDGKRVASSDYLNGVGVWAAHPEGNLVYQ